MTDSHVQAVSFIFMKTHQIRTHVFLLRNGIPVTELTEPGISFSARKQPCAQSKESFVFIMVHIRDVYIFCQYSPDITVFADHHFHFIPLI